MKRVRKILSDVLSIRENTITDKTSPSNTETWDSFNALMIVSELEREFKISFTFEEIAEVTCVGDITKALEKRGIKLHDK
ncbi:MAG: acyl carrier protein [Patescibacteria group bacterium]